MSGDRPILRSPAHGESAAAATASAAAAEQPAVGEGAPAGADSQWTSWRNLWQVPTIAISIALIVIGLRSAVRPPMGHDFDGALAQVQQFIDESKVDEAYAQLRRVIEPNIDKATLTQQARFYALSADLTFVSQELSGRRSDANNRHITGQYAIAEELGLTFSAARLERRGSALLALGEFEAADATLARIKFIAEQESSAQNDDDDADEGDERARAAIAYGRLFRAVIESQLQRPVIDSQRVMELLAEYRLSSALSQRERRWVAARLAELRLETGQAEAAINGLLLEMRRLEPHRAAAAGSDGGADEDASFGELYMLLGRGYYDMGDARIAEEHLARALTLLSASEPARGDALVLLGRVALSAGEVDAAIEKFNIIASEFVGTRSHLPGLLGKAECESLLGDHASSQAGFREVASLLRRSPLRRDVAPELVAGRLCDRHDAAISMGRLERALEYVSIAELLFDRAATPVEVLIRKAATNRQMAEDLLASIGSGGDRRGGPDGVVDGSGVASTGEISVDAAVRYEANQRFAEAAEDYLRHSSSSGTSSPLSEEDWSASLWLAADCFDRGGRHRDAILTFEKYLGSRPPDDQRKAEVMFRLAQAHEALMEYEDAAHAYERVLADRSRSGFAARCYVPLARCYAALDRADEARQTLQRVVQGEGLISPEARDFRDAMIDLGRLHHRLGEYVRAIERLTEAWARYPDDPRLAEIQYLLADSYRNAAMELAQRMQADSGMSPAERDRLSSLRREHLQEAVRVFAMVVDAHASGTQRAAAAAGGAGAEGGAGVMLSETVRRAHLYQADCVFELGRFDQAVELYESAARQYSGAASSMYALVQIVNCYAAMGEAERAAAAHQRALLRLQQLPESAFASPDALMDRSAWERWLRNSPVGGRAGSTVAASAASG